MSNEKYSYNHVQFTVSNAFKADIEEMAEECGYKTISDFIRAAIKEKIRRFKEPELFNQSASNIDPDLLASLHDKLDSINHKQDLTLERSNTINQLNERVNLLQSFLVSSNTDAHIKQQILSVFKTKRSVSIKDLNELLTIDSRKIEEFIKVLQKQGRISLNPTTGRYELND